MRKQRTESGSLELDGDGVIAVVADSHSNPHPRAHELIAESAPIAIVHAGDIGNHRVLDELEEIAPVFAVRGNIDAISERTPDHLIIDLEERSKRRMRLLLTHIAVHGPRLRKDARDRANQHEAQLVVCGHSHVPLVGEDRGLTIFNPGSLGPRRFHLPITFGVLEVRGGRMKLRHIDCETGETWTPPAR